MFPIVKRLDITISDAPTVRVALRYEPSHTTVLEFARTDGDELARKKSSGPNVASGQTVTNTNGATSAATP